MFWHHEFLLVEFFHRLALEVPWIRVHEQGVVCERFLGSVLHELPQAARRVHRVCCEQVRQPLYILFGEDRFAAKDNVVSAFARV